MCVAAARGGGEVQIKAGRYNLRASVALSIGGIPGVLIAAYVVKKLPLLWLRWLVVVVVTYAALTMLASAWRARQERGFLRLTY